MFDRPVRRTWLVILLPVFLAGVASPAPVEHPKLAVLIVLDGLPGDLTERYATLFTGGLRRLYDGGWRYTRAMVDHAITVSHAGHVTIATGRYPAHHGVVDAGYYVTGPNGRRHLVDAVVDSAEVLVGDTGRRIGASPRQVLTDGLAEWFVRASPQARIAAVGTGQYASVLHVFHPGAPVFWYDRQTGRYVTSSYYLRALPDWVARFNDTGIDAIADTASNWTPLRDLSHVDLGRADSNGFERYGHHSAFPHRLVDEIPPGATVTALTRRRWLNETPFNDEVTLHLAAAAVRSLALGQRGVTDYLAIVASETDNDGHSYGPNSHEELDILLRLDRWLGEFFDDLDHTVGRGQWVIALTADHGMPEIPEYEIAHGRPGIRVTEAMIDSLQAEVARLTSSSRRADIRATLMSRPWIAATYSPAQLARSPSTDSFLTLYRHSWRPDRVPRLPLFRFADGTSAIAAAGWMVRLVPGAVIDLDPAAHGSPYEYDRHVPLIFYGPGVAPGASRDVARTVDVAPTLAFLAGIAAPSNLDGHVLPGAACVRRR